MLIISTTDSERVGCNAIAIVSIVVVIVTVSIHKHEIVAIVRIARTNPQIRRAVKTVR